MRFEVNKRVMRRTHLDHTAWWMTFTFYIGLWLNSNQSFSIGIEIKRSQRTASDISGDPFKLINLKPINRDIKLHRNISYVPLFIIVLPSFDTEMHTDTPQAQSFRRCWYVFKSPYSDIIHLKSMILTPTSIQPLNIMQNDDDNHGSKATTVKWICLCISIIMISNMSAPQSNRITPIHNMHIWMGSIRWKRR